MHTNVILINKRRKHAQSNYTNTKLKAYNGPTQGIWTGTTNAFC